MHQIDDFIGILQVTISDAQTNVTLVLGPITDVKSAVIIGDRSKSAWLRGMFGKISY